MFINHSSFFMFLVVLGLPGVWGSLAVVTEGYYLCAVLGFRGGFFPCC